MIGLDTNVLIRLIVADDPDQSRRARSYLDKNCSPKSPGFVNCVVLTELIWVLGRSYSYSRQQIADVVDGLLDGDDRVIEHHAAVAAALQNYRTGKLDFIDALMMHINRIHSCITTATFDRKAARHDGFTLLR